MRAMLKECVNKYDSLMAGPPGYESLLLKFFMVEEVIVELVERGETCLGTA